MSAGPFPPRKPRGTLPGAIDGYKFIFTLQPERLLDLKLWIYAFGQAFFSLSVAGNGSVIYGSYLGKDVEISSSARNVAIFDTLAALVAMIVIIPAMATTGSALDTNGPGLMFIALPGVFNGMGGIGWVVAPSSLLPCSLPVPPPSLTCMRPPWLSCRRS